eukprot:4533930-Prymnesium_polylepis.1
MSAGSDTPACRLPVRDTSSGRWYAASDGRGERLQYDLTRCRLRRFDASAARRCLSGRHIVLAG